MDWRLVLARAVAARYAPICESKCGYDEECLDKCVEEYLAVVRAYEVSAN